jgi:dihydrofolate reductase
MMLAAADPKEPRMSRVTCDLAISVDGFTAGPNQTIERPFGDGEVDELTRWMFDAADANRAEIDAIVDAGAYIMGRNMFGPIRGPWTGDWTGWWGPEPPYHAPVFVLTHHPREPLAMQGGTTFHFVTDGPAAALELAREAAGDRDVAIAGGAATANQYLAAGSIDELRLHVAPVALGRGERLFDGVPTLLDPVAVRESELVTHVTYLPRRS